MRIDEILDMRYWRKEPGDCRCRLDTMENGEWRLKVGGGKLETENWKTWRCVLATDVGSHTQKYIIEGQSFGE